MPPAPKPWPTPNTRLSASGAGIYFPELAKNPAGTHRPTDQALLGEFIALRTIVANLVYALTDGGKVTAEQMRAFVERADQTKLKWATDLLSRFV
jgi:hypothetical protein